MRALRDIYCQRRNRPACRLPDHQMIMETRVRTATVEISSADISQIRAIEHFKSSIYHDLDLNATVEFFTKRYVEPLKRYVDITQAVAADCAAGYGWFTIAYLLAEGKGIVAADVDRERLLAAEEIAGILELSDRIKFVHASLPELSLGDNEVEIFVSIETLEHIGKQNILRALQKMKVCTSQAILLTTPNRLFPIVAHDTRLPFLHWLPAKRRNLIATMFGRAEMNHENDFLSPLELQMLGNKFAPVSRCLTFPDYKSYEAHYPFYLPYGPNEQERWQTMPLWAKATYYKWACGLFRQYSHWVMPSLARIFLRT